MLPKAFTDRMQKMLPADEQEAFLKSYEKPEIQALRRNPLKGDRGRFLALAPFALTQVPWEENGYYYGEMDRPGKHPYHEAGVYYIQEASAMAPAAYLEAQPGERILDLCAAPGGKSTQIAAAMEGKGILICNEINRKRAEILAENIERLGIRNAIVVSHEPAELAALFPSYFDRILVDAPCSGEGMFRKNGEAILEWSEENVERCAVRQDGILDSAAAMLAPGGRLIYSTCTFAPAENEGTVMRFLSRHPEFSMQPLPLSEGMEHGRAEFCTGPVLSGTVRLWPHKLQGEGHFLAAMQKAGYNEKEERCGIYGYETSASLKDCKEYTDFIKEELTFQPGGVFVRFGEQLYLLPEGAPSLKGLKVLRCGLHLGTCKKNRFEPGHALALSLRASDCMHSADFSADSEEIRKYLRGETFSYDGENGWYLITVDGYSIGWGKCAGGVMKNHYPKGLRKNF